MKIDRYLISLLITLFVAQASVAQSPTPPDPNPPEVIFDKSKDLFIAQFDSKPDPDDIHSIAAVGSLLAHPDFHNIDFYAVQGSVGHQGWFKKEGTYNQFIAAPALMNLAFGKGQWTQAGNGLRNTFPNTSNYADFKPANTNWTASVKRVRDRAKAAIDRGGKVYVMEAGNSDFTADWVKELQDDGMSAKVTRSQIVVVQHSSWNESQTTSIDRRTKEGNQSRTADETVVLNYVKGHTDYRRIADGNGKNATPAYNQGNSKWLDLAEDPKNPNTHARSLWIAAEKAMSTVYSRSPNTYPRYSPIKSRGVDFSDAVEAWYIFNCGDSADTIEKFWQRYVINNDSGKGPAPR